jgi:hypothetical protein
LGRWAETAEDKRDKNWTGKKAEPMRKVGMELEKN